MKDRRLNSCTDNDVDGTRRCTNIDNHGYLYWPCARCFSHSHDQRYCHQQTIVANVVDEDVVPVEKDDE
jgi:hypothetical protein